MASPPPSDAALAPATPHAAPAADGAFVFVGDRLWLDFVNTDDAGRLHTGHAGARVDALADFETFVRWLEVAVPLDGEWAAALRRRAQQQPAGATAVLADARRVRASLRALAERSGDPRAGLDVRAAAVAEINRILGRSAGTRRLETRAEGGFARAFAPVGDAFASLLIPIVDSAADSLIAGELARVRRCADPRCARVFHDATKNGRRRWCDMAGCGNRAKAARHREKRGVGHRA
jgi:predicted RNA-binding Zn ribbon-like protein